MKSIACIALLFALPLPVVGQTVVEGEAEVIDADIIKIGQQRVILWGIDAPDRPQSCFKDGRRWGCYEAARRTLELLAGRAEVTCYLVGEPDPFNRMHGTCESGGTDLNAEMVRRGMAVAYLDQTDAYADAQLDAISDEVGVWAIGVDFELPWDFRIRTAAGGYR